LKSTPASSALLGPVRSQTLDSAVIVALAAYVEQARIALGEKLPSERLLCERLEVSRPTVREALKRWEALGIVEMRKGSGVYLRKPVGRNILHVPLVLNQASKVKGLLYGLQVRRALEGEAAAICAASASADRIAMIEKALVRMESAHAKGNSSEEDWEYHQTIIEATGNPLFTQIIQSMRDLVHQFWENPLQLPNFAATSFPFHRSMFDAISRRDPVAARVEALKIIDSVGEEIREAYPHEA
jgi:DNA-binding FadR family transcriptional regulator